MRNSFRLSAIALTVAAAIAMPGCVEQLGEIDRTQANVLKKSDFHGVWYRLGVITDMPMSAGFGFVGQTNFGGTGGKVVFDIQENHLVVYPFTETIKEGDSKWSRKRIRNYWDKGKSGEFVELYVGNPVALFPIVSHFDVIRDYSTATGAQSNVKVENTTDRPWWERDYMRVNWMGNSFAEFFFPQGSVAVSSVDHYVQEHETDDPNRFYMEYFTDKDGDRVKDKGANYFHYTRRLYGQPMSTGSCSTYSLAFGDCSGAVFDVRISYRRADPRQVNDFEIRDYHNDPDAERFGYFMSSRYTFDEEYGLTYSGHDYKAQIWNLWQKSKTFTPYKDDKGKTKSCVSNYDCDAPTVCDQSDWFKPGTCSIGHPVEYTQRGLKPIICHLSADHPKTSLGAAYHVADNWSEVFKETVSWLYFWEEKWGQDKVGDKPIKGFEDADSVFGQRFCAANTDCANHAVAQLDVPIPDDANTLAVGTEKGVMVVVDEIATRETIGGDAYIMLVNASPGTGKATLKVGSLTIAGAEFKAGKVDGHASAGKLPKSEVSGRMTITVEAGGKTATLPNADIRKNRIHWVVFYGGDQIAMVEDQLTKQGVRAFHAINAGKTKNAQGTQFTAGEPLEIGVNGVREKGPVEYGNFTDYVHHTSNTVHAVFLKPGSRGDVTCMQIDGRGVCSGWKQTLTEVDRKRRVEILEKELPHTYVLCTNVYTGGANPESCGGPNERAKALNDCRYWHEDKQGNWHNPCKEFVVNADKPKMIGDARYNYIYWVTNPHASSPLGYGPSAADPDTGQLFWGSAYIYGAALTTYGQYGKDLVDLLNGDLDVDSLINGQYIKSYIQAMTKAGVEDTEFGAAKSGHGHDHAGHAPDKANKRGQLPASYFTAEAAAKRATKSIRKELYGRANDDELARIAKVANMPTTELAEQKMVALQDPDKLAEKFMDETPTFDMSEVKARWEKLRGTPIERALINDEMALTLSNGQVQPGDAIDPDMMKKISPATWGSPVDQMDERKRLQFLGIHNIYPAEFTDPALVGMAKRLKCDPGEEPTTELANGADNIGDKVCYKGSALRIALQNAIFRGVLEHEIGHTVGLRHNFSASADVLNYFDGYYDIREKEPVYCASIDASTFANDMCEQSLGETCKYIQCSGDSECPAGYACGNGSCVDTNSTKVGICEGSTDTYFRCSSDTDCESAGGVCRVDGWCGAKVGCQANGDCLSGEICAGGVCANQLTGKPRTTVLKHSKTELMNKFMPRPAPTKGEIDQRRTEYQYSSIMDYGQKINADFMGLGKYDVAAIKYGYGRLLEVFSDTSFMRRQLEKYAKNTSATQQGSAWRMRTTSWEFAGSITHPFMYLNNWMPPEYLKKRDAVPGFWVEAEPDLAEKYGRSVYDKTYFEVPYKYCSDEYRGGSLACYYFDTGAHLQEIVYHAAEQLREYYVFDAFKRERLWFGWYGSPSAYMSRIQSRYMLPIMAAARYYAVYNNIFRIYSFFPFYDNHPMYMRGLKHASEMAFRELANVLTSPAPGSYTFDKDSNTYVNISFKEKAAGSQLDIPIGVGKLPYTTFATDNGYYYAQHPLWIGAIWDKIAAIFSMTNSSASFLTDFVGEQLPLFRGTAIGFNTLYPKELSEVLGGVAAGATDRIGGYAVAGADGKLSYEPRNPFEPNDPTKARVPGSINNLTLRLWAATLSIVNLPAGFDPSYTDGMAVWLKGSGHAHYFGSSQLASCGSAAPDNGNNPPAVCVDEYYDPVGKKTYVAPRPNYSKTFFSPTHYIVKRLNELKSQWQVATGAEKQQLHEEMKRELEILDYYRLLYKVFGSIGA